MFSSPAVAGELAFIGSCNGVVHAIDRLTGRARWKYNALQDGGKAAEFHGIPVVTADLVVFGSDDRNPRRRSSRRRWSSRNRSRSPLRNAPGGSGYAGGRAGRAGPEPRRARRDGAYDRHSYDPERRAALEAWGRRLEAIVSGKPAKGQVAELSAGRQQATS